MEQLEVKRSEVKLQYTKLKAALRFTLMGMAEANRDWFRALRAFDFAEQHHVGFRKDQVTPNFMHQVQIALYLMNHLRYYIDPVGVIVAVLLHDVSEDHHIDFERIAHLFGESAARDVRLLTKKFRGEIKDKGEYYDDIARSANASVGKGGDRVNNIMTMAGVFSLEKQIQYCDETRTEFFKFLKIARKLYPEQTAVYENIKFSLETQLRLYEAAHSHNLAL